MGRVVLQPLPPAFRGFKKSQPQLKCHPHTPNPQRTFQNREGVLVRRARYDPLRAPRFLDEGIHKSLRGGIHVVVCDQPEDGKCQMHTGGDSQNLSCAPPRYCKFRPKQAETAVRTPSCGGYGSLRVNMNMHPSAWKQRKRWTDSRNNAISKFCCSSYSAKRPPTLGDFRDFKDTEEDSGKMEKPRTYPALKSLVVTRKPRSVNTVLPASGAATAIKHGTRHLHVFQKSSNLRLHSIVTKAA